MIASNFHTENREDPKQYWIVWHILQVSVGWIKLV